MQKPNPEKRKPSKNPTHVDFPSKQKKGTLKQKIQKTKDLKSEPSKKLEIKKTNLRENVEELKVQKLQLKNQKSEQSKHLKQQKLNLRENVEEIKVKKLSPKNHKSEPFKNLKRQKLNTRENVEEIKLQKHSPKNEILIQNVEAIIKAKGIYHAIYATNTFEDLKVLSRYIIEHKFNKIIVESKSVIKLKKTIDPLSMQLLPKDLFSIAGVTLFLVLNCLCGW